MDKYTELKKEFEIRRDSEKARQMAAYMRNIFSFYGIQTPIRRKIYKDFLKKEKKRGIIDWTLLDKCYSDEHREFQYFVVDYLKTMQSFLTYNDLSNIKKYIKTKQWWDTIDGLDKIIGHIGLVDKRVDDLMIQWSVDEDFWLRRVAINHQRGRKNQTNTHLLERIIVNNFGSSEFFINKAIGWSLREYSKTNPAWVSKFVDIYKNKMDNLSIKEASKFL